MRIKVSGNYLITYFSNLFSITLGRAAYVALFFLICEGLIAEYNNIRALWVVRDHMITPESIDKVLTFAKINNYNHLFVQVRGRGDAYYQSNLVPRSHLHTHGSSPKHIPKKLRGSVSIFRCQPHICVLFVFSANRRLASTQLLFEVPSLRVMFCSSFPQIAA